MAAEQTVTGSDVVRRLHEAFNARDAAGLWDCLAPDVAWHVEGAHPMAGTYAGRDVLWANYLEPLWPAPFSVAADQIVEHGEYVVAVGQQVHNFGDGDHAWQTVEVFRVDGDVVCERHAFTSNQAELDRLLGAGCPAGG